MTPTGRFRHGRRTLTTYVDTDTRGGRGSSIPHRNAAQIPPLLIRTRITHTASNLPMRHDLSEPETELPAPEPFFDGQGVRLPLKHVWVEFPSVALLEYGLFVCVEVGEDDLEGDGEEDV